MRRFRMLALGASMLVLLSACSTGGGSPQPTTGASSAVGPPGGIRRAGPWPVDGDGLYSPYVVAAHALGLRDRQ